MTKNVATKIKKEIKSVKVVNKKVKAMAKHIAVHLKTAKKIVHVAKKHAKKMIKKAKTAKKVVKKPVKKVVHAKAKKAPVKKAAPKKKVHVKIHKKPITTPNSPFNLRVFHRRNPITTLLVTRKRTTVTSGGKKTVAARKNNSKAPKAAANKVPLNSNANIHGKAGVKPTGKGKKAHIRIRHGRIRAHPRVRIHVGMSRRAAVNIASKVTGHIKLIKPRLQKVKAVVLHVKSVARTTLHLQKQKAHLMHRKKVIRLKIHKAIKLGGVKGKAAQSHLKVAMKHVRAGIMKVARVGRSVAVKAKTATEHVAKHVGVNVNIKRCACRPQL